MIETVIDIRGTQYWAWIATFYLILLTVQDYRNKRKVDQRRNFVMLGVTISLISHVPVTIWYLLALIGVVIAFDFYLRKFQLIGEGDIAALRWIFLGFGYLSPIFLMMFGLIFIIVTLIYTSFKLYLFKYKGPTPFFVVILACFWFNSFIYGLY